MKRNFKKQQENVEWKKAVEQEQKGALTLCVFVSVSQARGGGPEEVYGGHQEEVADHGGQPLRPPAPLRGEDARAACRHRGRRQEGPVQEETSGTAG